MKYHRDCGVTVYVAILDTLEEVKEKVPGMITIIDGKVCGSTNLTIEPSKCSGTHAFFVNSIEGGEPQVREKKDLFSYLKGMAMDLKDFLAKFDTDITSETARMIMMEDDK